MTPDALLMVSFGGPEGPDDVLPFLRNVTAGRGIPDERLATVADQYALFGGVSPINQQCRDLIAALRVDFAANDLDLPIYWGNRNWDPYLTDTIAQMADDGVQHAVAFVTSAYSSYSGCRQYRENIAAARRAVGDAAPVITKIRQFFNHPGFIEPLADNVRAALAAIPETHRDQASIAFTAHSIPLSMAATSDYQAQLRSVAELIVERVDPTRRWSLVFQSRSGPPQVPWLEPDIVDHLDAEHDANTSAVVIAPIGFISDHMEVIYDLDTQAKAHADKLGLPVERAATVGVDPRFVTMIRQLVLEHTDAATPVALGPLGVRSVPCALDCCPAPQRPKR